MKDLKDIAKYKKLIFIFVTTFVVVLLASTHIATMLTPEIDIPVLNSDSEEVTNISSEDFNTRIDSRLKLIAMQDKEAAKTNPAPQYNQTEKKKLKPITLEETIEDKKQEPDRVLLRRKGEPIVEEPVISDIKFDEDEKEDEATQDNESSISPNSLPTNVALAPVIPKKNVATTVPSRPPIPIRQKIEVQPKKIQMIKVIVGNYNTPDDARNASEKLSHTLANVTPFIKEYNGMYTVQVGSFTNPETANIMVQELKSKNLYVRVIKE